MNNLSVYAGLEPAEVWRHFAALNDIPRPSKHEEAAREYVKRVASEHNSQFQMDDYGNIVVRVPASSEALKEVTLVSFQSHLDMVCQNLPDFEFDPLRDPIKVYRDGDYISAEGTSLGADNGIGVALMLALLTSPDVEHGPLELLFTVEEEIGLIGAMNLDPSLITSRTMVNLDGGDVTIGCATGEGVDIDLSLKTESIDHDNCRCYDISISGLQGGHSGIQIHLPRGNAIKLLTKVLLQLNNSEIQWNLSDFQGGSLSNAIPRDASATIAVSAQDGEKLEKLIHQQAEALKQTWAKDEPGLELKVLSAESCKSTFDQPSSLAVIQLLDALPHGVHKMSERFKGRVHTSCSLANANICSHEPSKENGSNERILKIHVSSRSTTETELNELQERIVKIAQDAGAQTKRVEGFPGWEPREDSKLAGVVTRSLEKASGEAPEVKIIHGGLECGVIVGKIPDLDVIAIGAEMYDLHSPDEYVIISSVEMIWKAVKEIVAEYAAEKA